MEKEYLTKETKSIKNNALKTLVIVLITAALIAPSVYSAPPSRQLTEIETNDYGTDNLATFITNSNGNYWEETGVNLYTALGGAGGDIIAYIPGNAHPYPNGHEFYVNGSYGSDTNLGNIDSPFATIQYGVGMLRAGDTLFIRGGTYVENYVKLNHSHGSIDNYITIKPYNDEDVKLKATITINDSYFIKIEGLQIYDTPSYGIGGSLGYAGEEIHNIIIDNCLINNTFNAGIYLNGIDEWNTIDSIQITNNELHHLNTGGSNEGIAPNYCSNITISNNYLYDCYKEMIALDTCSYATVNNNIINMTEPSDDTYSQCIGIRSNSFSGGNITDINVSNNWIWGNHTNVGIEIIGFENPSSPGSHSKIYCYNNIISGTARGIDIMGSDSTPEWANKINNVSIVHNTIYNTSGAGIRFNDSVNDESDIDNLTVMNNIMVHKDGHFGFINYPSSDIDLNNFSVDYNFFTMNISGYHTSGGSHPGSNNVNEWSESDWGYDIFKKASTNHNKIGIYYEDLSLIATCNATDAGGDLYDWYSDYLGNTRLINNRDIGAFERNDAGDFGIADGYHDVTKIWNSNGNYWTATDANLQLAAWDLNDTGGTIHIPSGVMEFDQTVYIEEHGIRLVGSGNALRNEVEDGTVFKMMADLPDGMICIQGTISPYFYIRGCKIENIMFWGNDENYNGCLLKTNHTKSPTIEHCGFDEMNGSAIIINSTHESLVKNCWFDECGNNVAEEPVVLLSGASNSYRSTTPTFRDCIFEPCDYGWIHVDYDAGATSCQRMKLYGNYFEASYSGFDGTFGDGIRPSYYAMIVNNDFHGGNIEAYINATNTACDNMVIDGNNFNDGGYNGMGQITLSSGTMDNIISNNNFRNSANASIYLTTGSVSITNNIITNAKYAIQFNGAVYDSIISNNMIKNSDSNAIYMLNANNKNIVISDNNIIDSGMVSWGCGISYGGENITITGNNIVNVDNGGNGIRINSNVNGSLVSNNYVDDIAGTEIYENASSNDVIILDNFGAMSIFPTSNMTGIIDGFAYVSNGILNVRTADGSWLALDGSGGAADGYHDVTKIWNSNGNYWTATATNLQAAIWDLNSTSGGTVWLPSGTISMSSTVIDLENGICLKGTGVNSTFLQFNGASYGVGAVRKNNISISDLTIDGNGNTGNLISWLGVKDFRIENVNLYDTSANCLRVAEDSSTSTHPDRGFINNVYAKGVSGEYINIDLKNVKNTIMSNCIVEDNAEDFGFDFSRCENLTISNCIAINCDGGFKVTGDVGDETRYSQFNNLFVKDDCDLSSIEAFKIQYTHNCTFNGMMATSVYTGAYIYGTVVDSYFSDVSISDFTSFGFGIMGERCSVSNIIVRDGNGKGLSVYTADDILISNVQLDNTGNVGSVHAQYHIYNSQNISLTNGIIQNSNSHGVVFQGSDHIRLSSVSIFDSNNDGIDTTASACHDYSITDCDFLGNGGIGIDMHADDDYVTITNCNFGSGETIDNNAATSIVKDNIGYDYSNWLILPTTATLIESFLRYDDTDNQLEVYDDGSWVEFNAGAGNDGYLYDGDIHTSSESSYSESITNLETAVNAVGDNGWVFIPSNENPNPGHHTFYVAKTGSDSNMGTFDSPFLTIQQAVDVAMWGDTVYVREGSYVEEITMKRSGKLNYPITLSGYEDEKAVVDGTGITLDVWEGLIDMYSGGSTTAIGYSNLTFTKLNISHSDARGISTAYEGAVTSSNIKITNCEFYDIDRKAVNFWANGSGATGGWHTDIEVSNCSFITIETDESSGECITFANCKDVVFRDNYFRDCRKINVDFAHNTSNVLCHNNVLNLNSPALNSGGAIAIYVDGGLEYQPSHCDNITISNNYLFRNDTATSIWYAGIGVAAENENCWAENITVKNNVIAMNGSFGMGIFYSNSEPQFYDVSFLHNTVYTYNGGGAIDIDVNEDKIRNVVVANNILIAEEYPVFTAYKIPVTEPDLIRYNNLYYDLDGTANYNFEGANTPEATAITNENPMFEDTTTHRFGLASNSPAIDAALSTYAINDDFLNVVRPQNEGYDIGAYEFPKSDGYAYDGKIHNSNGNYWTATATNLQTSIWDLNSTSGGTVWIPVGTITTTVPILLPSNVELVGMGYNSVIECDDSVEIDVINNQNHYGSSYDNHITIRNLRIEGNNDNGQYTSDLGGGWQDSQDCGISICQAENVTIENVWVNNSFETGIYVWQANNTVIKGCTVTNSGSQIGESALDNMWMAGGIFVHDGHDFLITDNIVHDYHGDGIIAEHYEGGWTTESVIISDNICYNGHNGIWVETADEVNVLDNICHDFYWTGAYAENASGIKVSSCKYVSIKDNEIYDIANHPSAGGSALGIYASVDDGNTTDISGNIIERIEGRGIYGFLSDTHAVGLVHGNTFSTLSDVGMALGGDATNTTWLVHDNVVKHITETDSDFGIWISGTVQFASIKNNYFYDLADDAIWVNPTSADDVYVFIDGNTFNEIDQYAVYVNAPTGERRVAKITDNLFIACTNTVLIDSTFDTEDTSGNTPVVT